MFVLFGFPERQIPQDDALHVMDVDGLGPAAVLVDRAVFIGAGQRAAGGEARAVREDQLRLDADLVLRRDSSM